MADTTTNEIMLSMRGIHKSFGDLSVLRGIDLSLARGEVLAIIGSSGSGKSTLLRCINKLETIYRGSITIRGEKLCWTKNGESTATYASTADERRILMSTGMVFQQFNLFRGQQYIRIFLIKRHIHELNPTRREVNRRITLNHGDSFSDSVVFTLLSEERDTECVVAEDDFARSLVNQRVQILLLERSIFRHVA